MKKVLIAAAIAATTTGAQAADLARKAPVYKAPVAQVYDWTGLYFGVNAGVGVGRDFTSLDLVQGNIPITGQRSNLSPFGAIGGVQLGYNWQYRNIVFGVEADIQASGQRDDATCLLRCSPTGFIQYNQKIDWFGTARGRVGLATGPVLSYFTAGYAYGGVETNLQGTNGVATGTLIANETKGGYVVGSGVEASLGGNWTGKLEYLYINLGSTTGAFGFPAIPQTGTAYTQIRDNIFRAGLNYRIGGSGTYSAPVANWTGFYLGGNFGAGIARNVSSHTTGVPQRTDLLTLVPEGLLGGGQVGYNWQAGAWVFGVEADFQGSLMKDDKACIVLCTPTNFAAIDQRLPWLGTVRGRLGYSVGSTLFYGTAGFAYGEIKTTFNELNIGNTAIVTVKNQRSGWTVGGGIESPFNPFDLLGPNWTSKSEYLYVDLGRATTTFVPFALDQILSTRVQEHIMRTGINYHFNSPVIAKY